MTIIIKIEKHHLIILTVILAAFGFIMFSIASEQVAWDSTYGADTIVSGGEVLTADMINTLIANVKNLTDAMYTDGSGRLIVEKPIVAQNIQAMDISVDDIASSGHIAADSMEIAGETNITDLNADNVEALNIESNFVNSSNIETVNSIKIGAASGMEGVVKYDDVAQELEVSTDSAGTTWVPLAGGAADPPTAWLYNNVHTEESCASFGGTVTIVGTENICRFDLSECPTSWNSYLSWSTTQNKKVTCEDEENIFASFCDDKGTRTCNSGSHSWSNAARESCTTLDSPDTLYGYPVCTDNCPKTAYATVTQVGCY